MFGRRKKDSGDSQYQKLGREIAEHCLGYIRNYCDRVVYYRASQLLRQLTDKLDEYPNDKPDDDAVNKEKAVMLSVFQLHLRDALYPLQEQLTAQVDELYGDIFKPGGELRPFVLQYIQERFDEQYTRIADSGRYVAGLAETYIERLLDDPEDEPETPSA